MIEIKEGPKLDRAVAEAIGWRCRIVVGHRDAESCEILPPHDLEGATLLYAREPILETIGSDDPRAKKLIPHYSTDLNVAFDAAEQVGLFVEVRHLRKVKSNPWWAGDIVYARAPTPAVAVCAVILKLKEKTQ